MRIVLVVIALMAAACSRGSREPGRGDPDRGRQLMLKHECYDCHIVPGIDRKPGPGVPVSLESFADRDRITHGSIPLTRATLEQYIQKPKTVYPPALMPGIGDAPDEARDIAAYLMTLD